MQGKVGGKVVMRPLQHHTTKTYKGMEVQLHTLFNTGTRWNQNGVFYLYVLRTDLIIPVSYQMTRQRLSISKKVHDSQNLQASKI